MKNTILSGLFIAAVVLVLAGCPDGQSEADDVTVSAVESVLSEADVIGAWEGFHRITFCEDNTYYEQDRYHYWDPDKGWTEEGPAWYYTGKGTWEISKMPAPVSLRADLTLMLTTTHLDDLWGTSSIDELKKIEPFSHLYYIQFLSPSRFSMAWDDPICLVWDEWERVEE